MAAFRQAERLVGEQVPGLCAPYLPRDTGRLAASAVVGDGQVRWDASYAAAQYYRGGGQWFEKMKAAHGRELVRAAARLTGGRDE